MARRLKGHELRAICDPATLPFQSTEELPSLEGMIGQRRALDATTFGIGMRHHGYNMFVLGEPATGKTRMMRRVLAAAAEHEATASDLCYVHNFGDPYRPAVLSIPAGRGAVLRDEMVRLVEECKVRLPRAFEGEEFERRKSEILEELGQHQQEELARLEQTAAQAGFVVLRTPAGLAVAPAAAGRPLSQEEFARLSEGERERLAERGRALEEPVDPTLRLLRQHEREAREAHQRLVREVAAFATRQLIREIRDRFAGIAAVERYLDQVKEEVAQAVSDEKFHI